MSSMKDYFDKTTYKPVHSIGDRVRGLYCDRPFAGSVLVETLLDYDVGPYIVVSLDLPMKVEDRWVNMLKIKHSDLIDIKGSYESNRKTNRKKSTVGRNRRK